MFPLKGGEGGTSNCTSRPNIVYGINPPLNDDLTLSCNDGAHRTSYSSNSLTELFPYSHDAIGQSHTFRSVWNVYRRSFRFAPVGVV